MTRLLDWLVRKFVDFMLWLDGGDKEPPSRWPHYGVPPKEEEKKNEKI